MQINTVREAPGFAVARHIFVWLDTLKLEIKLLLFGLFGLLVAISKPYQYLSPFLQPKRAVSTVVTA